AAGPESSPLRWKVPPKLVWNRLRDAPWARRSRSGAMRAPHSLALEPRGELALALREVCAQKSFKSTPHLAKGARLPGKVAHVPPTDGCRRRQFPGYQSVCWKLNNGHQTNHRSRPLGCPRSPGGLVSGGVPQGLAQLPGPDPWRSHARVAHPHHALGHLLVVLVL